jgi:hypothetical protein
LGVVGKTIQRQWSLARRDERQRVLEALVRNYGQDRPEDFFAQQNPIMRRADDNGRRKFAGRNTVGFTVRENGGAARPGLIERPRQPFALAREQDAAVVGIRADRWDNCV